MQHGMKQPMLRVTTPSPAYIGVRLTYKTGATALLWGMSAMPDCTDLPDDPTALARIAVNGSESQDLRNAAWQKLIPIINRIAIDAARAYHCQEIEQEAVGYIWQKLQEGKFEPEKGRFDAWASVVLHHLAADLRKQFSRRLLHSAQQIDSLIEEIPDGRATGTGAAGDAFAQQLDRLRREFDRLSHLLPCETNGVAYFAVFLLQLRLAMARRASQAGFSDPICHSDFIAECLPWHREEAELRLRLGWPALSEVWEAICPLLDQPPHWITGIRLCDELINVFGESLRVAPDVWAQWVRRAKRAARQHLDRTWAELFAPFFPDR